MKVTVLGPPTIEQYPQVTRQAGRDAEYWMLHLRSELRAAEAEVGHANASERATAGSSAGRRAGRTTDANVQPGPVRWLVERLAEHQTQSVARLLHALDSAMNNTSLILLLEVGSLSMLMPGDAEIGDWRYTLDKLSREAELRDKLAGIDLYKVGHHGSRNATTRSLYQLWTQRPSGAPRLTALMSTRAGVYGTTPAPAVPRATLVEALCQVGHLHSTDGLPADQAFVEVVADASGGPFRVAQT